MSFNRKPVVAIRIEEVPGLCPETATFLSDAITKNNIGVKSERRDFLEDIDFTKTIVKVQNVCVECILLVIIFILL